MPNNRSRHVSEKPNPFDALRLALSNARRDFRTPTAFEMSPEARAEFLLRAEALLSWDIGQPSTGETIMGFPVKVDPKMPDGLVRLMDGPAELARFTVHPTPQSGNG